MEIESMIFEKDHMTLPTANMPPSSPSLLILLHLLFFRSPEPLQSLPKKYSFHFFKSCILGVQFCDTAIKGSDLEFQPKKSWKSRNSPRSKASANSMHSLMVCILWMLFPHITNPDSIQRYHTAPTQTNGNNALVKQCWLKAAPHLGAWPFHALHLLHLHRPWCNHINPKPKEFHPDMLGKNPVDPNQPLESSVMWPWALEFQPKKSQEKTILKARWNRECNHEPYQCHVFMSPTLIHTIKYYIDYKIYIILWSSNISAYSA